METLVTNREAHELETTQPFAHTKVHGIDDRRRITFCHFTTVHTALKSRSFHRQCLPLAEAGFDVRYISPAPVKDAAENIAFIQITPKRRAFGFLRRHMSLLRTLLRQNSDIYHFQDLQVLPLALALKLLFHKRVIYDAYEDFPSMVAQKASIASALRPLARKLMSATESFASRKLDAVLTADPLTLRRFARSDDGASEKRVFYNFPNLAFFPRPHSSVKRFDVVYRGGLSTRAGTFLLLDALRLLVIQNAPVRLLLLGYSDGPLEDHALRQRVAALGLADQVEIRGRIPHEEMASALGSARVGVCPLLDTPKFRLNIPVKIFEYWACGLPVIASDLPPSRPFMRGSDACVVVPPNDASALAGSIADLLRDPGKARQMGERGRAMIERRLNNRTEVRKLIALCGKLAGSPHDGSRGYANA